MIKNDTAQTKLIRNTWSFRGATAIYYATLAVRAVYPTFVWSFFLLAGMVSSNRRRR